ncbi:MAG TPA: VWA domain-containing protein [Acidobacteriaceae bacterium]
MFRRTRCFYLLVVAAAAGSSRAQSVSPAVSSAAPPAAAAQTQSMPAQSAQKPVTTLKANAQLVVVDVVVTDGNHKPVHGLKASDFALAEGNVPQTITHFEEHTALTAADATRFADMPKMPPDIFTNYTPAPANGAVNVLLLDSLNTPMRDQAYVRQQLLAYLKTAPPSTRIAIFGLTTRLIFLQGFTSDPETLKNAMSKSTGKGSALLDDQVGGGGTQNSMSDDMEDMGEDPDIVANLRQFEAQQQSFQLQLRAKYTLDAMNAIARYLGGIPGRKNLIWFSGSFPINILPDVTGMLPNPFAVMASSEDEFRDTVALLARSQVAVYPIDARGLMNSPVFDVTSNRNYGGRTGNARMQQDQNKFFSDTAEEHGTMRSMADATGGHAFVNTNGLTQAVASAIDEGSNFYTLTYVPSNSERDGKLRKIKIKLVRGGFNLAYRQGYYADRPNNTKGVNAGPTSAAVTGAGVLSPQATERMAMMRGAPTPAEILIKVGVVPMLPANQTEDKPAPSNTPAANIHGPYRRYAVNYAISPSDITFLRTGDGVIHAEFDLVIFVFDRDGQLINSVGQGVQVTASLEQVKQMFAKGINQRLEVSAPAKGEYFLRIAVHDKHHDRYGAVEVATSQVKDVAVPVASPAPGAPTAK